MVVYRPAVVGGKTMLHLDRSDLAAIRFVIGLRKFREALAENKVNLAEHYAVEYDLPKELWQKRVRQHKEAKKVNL